jgi:hypothetical protein
MKKFWVGDLCYVMHPEWKEFCNKSEKDGIVTLGDGRVVAFSSTIHGDGCYNDQKGNKYGVDAGLIGVIAVEDITPSEKKEMNGGHVHQFEGDLPKVYRDKKGVIHIGHLEIQMDEHDEELEELEDIDPFDEEYIEEDK